MATQGQLDNSAIGSDAGFAASLVGGSTQSQVSAGAAAAGATTLAILGPAAAAGPIGIAIGGAVLAIQMLSGKIAHLISGCGETCVQATQIVNEAESYVEQIASSYWQTPTRTKAFQTWTLQQLDSVFNQVRGLCGKIPGQAGVDCVQQRLTRGFVPPWCKSNDLAVGVDNVVAPNLNNILGRCGGWYDVTYDPIAKDPGVQPDPTPSADVAAALQSVASSVPGGYGTLVIAGVALLALIAYKVRTN